MKQFVSSRLDFILTVVIFFTFAVIYGLYHDRDPASGNLKWGIFVIRVIGTPAAALFGGWVFDRVRGLWSAAKPPPADAQDRPLDGQDN